MCGLVGIAGKMEFKDEATLKRLLLLDYFRGTDSTGVAAIRKDGANPIAKIASHPIDLFDTKAYEKVNHAYQTKVFIGHNRAATKGKVNGVNAHPYEYGHIIGAHNGTLDTSSWKALTDCLGYETDVDSMAIFACIEKVGIEETVKMLSGAWALTWVNLEERTLNFLRNKERPLWYAYEEEFNRVFWASEWPMIQGALGMDNSTDKYKIWRDDKDFSYFPFDEDYLYQLDIDKLNKGEYDEEPLVRVKKLKGKAPAPVVTYPQQGGSPFQGTISGGTTQTGQQTKTTGGSRGGHSHSSSIPNTPPYMTIVTSGSKPFANFLTKEEFKLSCNDKCGYCHEPVEFEDEGLVFFEGINEVLCGECSGHQTSRYMATPKTYMTYLNPPKVNVN